MKERPILFSGEMVRAILDGRKTQTRRVIQPQPVKKGAFWELYGAAWSQDGGSIPCVYGHSLSERNPYGKPGDRLWVRETWANYQTINHIRRPDGRSFSEVSDGLAAYRADGFDTIQDLKEHIRLMSGSDFEGIEVKDDKWSPSIHMPRWASRITLEITEVRVERLQDISERDCIAEGIANVFKKQPHHDGSVLCAGRVAHRQQFQTLWDSINGKKHPWESNPWVWVISFKTEG